VDSTDLTRTHHTRPHHTTPHHPTPHRTTPHHTAPHHTTPHHTTPYFCLSSASLSPLCCGCNHRVICSKRARVRSNVSNLLKVHWKEQHGFRQGRQKMTG